MLAQQPICPVLVGRAAELDTLVRALDGVLTGSGETILLPGDAGIGKSRLCRELRRRAASQQIRVIEGRCSSAEASVPYGPFMDALRFRLARGEGEVAARILGPLVTHLAPLLPDLPVSEPPPLPPGIQTVRPFEAIYQVVHRLAELGPVLLILEDFQWADPTSCDVLAHLSRRIRSDPVLLLVTYRSDELASGHPARRLAASLIRERLARELPLGPLTREEIGQMVLATTGTTPPGEFVDAAWRRTEGNPFFVEELLKALGESCGDGALVLRAEAIESTRVPLTISESVLSRAQPLNARCREVLTVAAVLGRRTSFDLLRAVTGMGEDELLDVIEQLVERHFIVEEPAAGKDVYAFRHVLTQEVLYNATIARRRRSWHRRVATVLEARPAAELASHYDTLAYHYRLGGDVAVARKYEILAGEQAARLCAWESAEAHFERALRSLEGTPEPDRDSEAALLERLADVTWWQGRVHDSLHYAEEALTLRQQQGNRPAAAELHRRLGVAYAAQLGQVERGVAALQEALDLLGRELKTVSAARAATDLGLVCLTVPDYPEAERWLSRAVAAARRLGHPESEATALAALGQLAVRRGDVRAGVEQLDAALRLAGEMQLPLDRMCTVFACGIRSLAAAWEHARLVQWLETAEQHAVRHGAVGDAALYRAYRAVADRRAGRLNRAVETARAAAEELRQMRRGELREGLRILGDLYRITGELAAARRTYAEALALGERDAEIGLALVALAGGTAGEAADALARALAARPEGERLLRLRVLPFQVEALLRAGRAAEARRALAELAVGVAGSDYRAGTAALAYATGLVRAHEGQITAAVSAFLRAITAWNRLEQPLERARAQLELATLCCDRLGDRARGVQLARDATTVFEALGAMLEVRRARTLLRRMGVQARPARRPAVQRPHGLTPREYEVLVHLAEGLTNREIAQRLAIAEKTVSVHVSRLLAKLRCTTRTEAVSYALTQHLVEAVPELGRREARRATV